MRSKRRKSRNGKGHNHRQVIGTLRNERLDFGIHSGKRLSEVPLDYLRWFAGKAGPDNGTAWIIRQYLSAIESQRTKRRGEQPQHGNRRPVKPTTDRGTSKALTNVGPKEPRTSRRVDTDPLRRECAAQQAGVQASPRE